MKEKQFFFLIGMMFLIISAIYYERNIIEHYCSILIEMIFQIISFLIKE